MRAPTPAAQPPERRFFIKYAESNRTGSACSKFFFVDKVVTVCQIETGLRHWEVSDE